LGVAKYDIKEADFQRTDSEKYELSILLGMGSFAYIVKETRTNRILVFRSLSLNVSKADEWSERMRKIVQEDEVLRPSLIKHISVGWITPRVSLLPIRLFDAGREKDYLSQLSSLGLDDLAYSTALPALGVQLMYAIGRERQDSVTRRFAPLKTAHYGSGLLSKWQEANRLIGHRAVYASIRDGQLVLAAMDAGKLLFFNIFQFTTAQDALYYTSLAYQQCGWGLDRVPLYLCGEVLTKSEVYRQLYRFIEDIRFLEDDGANGVSGPLLKQYPSHLYYDLLCQF
jgi:hypothetical protein